MASQLSMWSPHISPRPQVVWLLKGQKPRRWRKRPDLEFRDGSDEQYTEPWVIQTLRVA